MQYTLYVCVFVSYWKKNVNKFLFHSFIYRRFIIFLFLFIFTLSLNKHFIRQPELFCIKLCDWHERTLSLSLSWSKLRIIFPHNFSLSFNFLIRMNNFPWNNEIKTESFIIAFQLGEESKSIAWGHTIDKSSHTIFTCRRACLSCVK